MVRKLSRRETLASVAAGFVAAGRATVADAGRSARRMPDVRVGIIGLEGHTSELFEVVRMRPEVRITAIADSDKEQLAHARQNAFLAAAEPYSDYRKMLDGNRLDIVAVCGENSTRAGIVQECARRKLAIIAEKPLALDFAELEATRKLIAETRVPLSMLLSMRFEPQYQRMRAVVEAGQIGEVVAMGSQKSYKLGERPAWMKSRRSFGGTIPYIGIHMIDLMRWVGRREFTEAAAFQSTVGAPQAGEMENNVALIFRLDNRGTASLRMDYLRPPAAPTHGDDRLRIVGTRGVVEYQQSQGVTLITESAGPVELKDLPPQKFLFQDFLESIYTGKKHLISQEDIFRLSEIVLKARDAAEGGRIVAL